MKNRSQYLLHLRKPLRAADMYVRVCPQVKSKANKNSGFSESRELTAAATEAVCSCPRFQYAQELLTKISNASPWFVYNSKIDRSTQVRK